jgi:hypothetical protein
MLKFVDARGVEPLSSLLSVVIDLHAFRDDWFSARPPPLNDCQHSDCLFGFGRSAYSRCRSALVIASISQHRARSIKPHEPTPLARSQPEQCYHRSLFFVHADLTWPTCVHGVQRQRSSTNRNRYAPKSYARGTLQPL